METTETSSHTDPPSSSGPLFLGHAISYGLGVSSRMGKLTIERDKLIHEAISKKVTIPASNIKSLKKIELSGWDRLLQVFPQAAFQIDTSDGLTHVFVLRNRAREFENALLLLRGLPGNGAEPYEGPKIMQAGVRARKGIEAGRYDTYIDLGFIGLGLLLAYCGIIEPWLAAGRKESNILIFQKAVIIVPYLLAAGSLRLLGGPKLRKAFGLPWKPEPLGVVCLSISIVIGILLYFVLAWTLWRHGYKFG